MNKLQKEFCKLHNLTEKQFLGKEEIEGNLSWGNVTELPKGINVKAGGDIYLSSLTTMPEGCTLTAGGYIYLSSGKIKGNPPGNIPKLKNPFLTWQDGKYIMVDGVFTEVISKDKNVWKVKKLLTSKEFYLVSGGGFYAHGDTIEKAKEDLRFKRMAEKLKNEPIKPDTIVTMNHYRLITGSCQFGVDEWMKNNIPAKDLKNTREKGIKAKDLFPILKKTGAYGLSNFEKLYQI